MGMGRNNADVEEFVAESFRTTMVDGHVDAIGEYFSDRLDYYSSSRELAGRAELRDDVEMFHIAFPDVDGRIQRMLSQDGTVSFTYELSGTHEGDFDGVPPTGETMATKGAAIVHVDDEITEWRIVFDNLGMLEQLGVLGE